MLIILAIITTIIVSLTIFFIATYIHIKKLRNNALITLEQIKYILLKYLDTLSIMTEVLGSYILFEKEVRKSIGGLRMYIESIHPNNLSKAIKEAKDISYYLIKTIDRYPYLYTVKIIKKLIDESMGIEDKMYRYCNAYNDIVQRYNDALDTFQGRIITYINGFRKLAHIRNI